MHARFRKHPDWMCEFREQRSKSASGNKCAEFLRKMDEIPDISCMKREWETLKHFPQNDMLTITTTAIITIQQLTNSKFHQK